MSKNALHLRRCIGICMMTALLVSCDTSGRGISALRLPPCSAEGSIFAKLPFDQWATTYHTQVDKVIEAHLKSMRDTGTKPLQCTATNYADAVPPSSALTEAATMIPAWKDRTADLHEADMQPVLLELLRVYECSMDEDAQFLPVLLTKGTSMDRGTFMQQMNDVKSKIAQEKAISRETLDRALGVVSGFDRLQPLSLDIECLKRSSLDLRNALGLASDVTSCLPRIWDAKGSLRDLAQ